MPVHVLQLFGNINPRRDTVRVLTCTSLLTPKSIVVCYRNTRIEDFA